MVARKNLAEGHGEPEKTPLYSCPQLRRMPNDSFTLRIRSELDRNKVITPATAP